MIEPVKLTKKDFETDQEVRWCPGCGDYAILAAVQRFLPELDTPKENHVFLSGIGCAARFPYYMNTYGMHTIHGRAPGFATGLKIANPDLTVWICSGDGDLLSIGGNHTMHVMRRNLDINILLFNNRIYGLTKGQYSPTSEQGKITKSTPFGSVEAPLDPISFALNCGATFVARGLDVDPKGLVELLRKAEAHKGTSFVEIFQNCNVFNDGAHKRVADKPTRKENQLVLQHGEPMIYGAEDDKAITLDGHKPRQTSADEADLVKYDQTDRDMAMLVSHLQPGMPVPMGVFYQVDAPTYDEGVVSQVEVEKERKPGDLKSLLYGADTWDVE
ncbi:MAG: 2-oxoacid:ferredoxin oxidoreductase subunit beta [Verrucomicrobiota bacterium]